MLADRGQCDRRSPTFARAILMRVPVGGHCGALTRRAFEASVLRSGSRGSTRTGQASSSRQWGQPRWMQLGAAPAPRPRHCLHDGDLEQGRPVIFARSWTIPLVVDVVEDDEGLLVFFELADSSYLWAG